MSSFLISVIEVVPFQTSALHEGAMLFDETKPGSLFQRQLRPSPSRVKHIIAFSTLAGVILFLSCSGERSLRTSVVLDRSEHHRRLQSGGKDGRMHGQGGTSHGPIRLPNLLQIGGQKCGSSALSEWLTGQGVCEGELFEGEPYYFAKESHFFDEPPRYEKGIEFYAKRFGH